MKANLSLYNAIFNIWVCSVHSSRQIGVTSLVWRTCNCQLFSCVALKTIPFCFEIVVTFCPQSFEVHTSIRCIQSDVARTSRSNCRRKALDFLRLFGDGYFICTDCQRDFMRTSLFPYVSNGSNISFEASHGKKHTWVGIYRLNHNKFK